MRLRHHVLSVLLTSCCLSTLPSQAQTLTIAWREKPPHQYIENGQEKGILLMLAKHVFADSKLKTIFVEEPAKRIWQNFKNGKKNYCSFGWYKIAEREALVQYSDSFYKDPPHTLLVGNSSLTQVRTHKNLKSLLADPSLSLAIVDGVSYGDQLDQLFLSSKNKIIRSSAAPMIMVRMINANRASMMLIDKDDWHYLSSKDEQLSELTQVDVEGMPAGLDRYIVCSKDVASDTMIRINSSLAKISGTKTK
ncbi:transporter substrate-binding domain-containing protein [Undibacterium flavidum]|uniref:Transporter substrate-binding domain-containing protein n=1 Tax=Undibacterium flavidum TaxID=2762297 RepID=A0ABR6Y8S3_9BURK|nr:transporter substrate-binding domain-containing protein [Undibacterium flavidum]MBC3872969.1 transporter substrate-binding domain-containing protein [Undibacterium flavidum]